MPIAVAVEVYMSRDTRQANARLIAAAPAMLEALRQIILPLRELLEEDVPDYVATIDVTTTALRLGLNAYDKAAKA